MIIVKVAFFSFIKFETQLDTIQVRLADKATIEDLVKALEDTYGEPLINFLYNKMKKVPVALFMIDNQMCNADYILSDGDEIKIMPTVAGG